MADHQEMILELLQRMESLTEELKLLHLDLAVAGAKLHLEESPLQVAAVPLGKLVDAAAASYDQATMVLKRAKGEALTDESSPQQGIDLNYYLDKIQRLAEEIIRLVFSAKKEQTLNQEYEA